MKAIMIMFDSLNRHLLSPYGCDWTHTPNFQRLAERTVTFDNAWVGSMPCMPARRELHTGRYNFLHRSWGPLEPFDFSMPHALSAAGVHTHIVTDHAHYTKAGGNAYLNQYTTWEFKRGQAGDNAIPRVGHLAEHGHRPNIHDRKGPGIANDVLNRQQQNAEQDWPQVQCFQDGLDYLEHNHDKDHWFLQIETFDPHEPFCSPESYRKLAGCGPPEEGLFFDWPAYRPVTENVEDQEKIRREYAATLAMCDTWLGKVLDFMDHHDLWKETFLIVNTDHGFLLNGHGW